MSIIFIMLLARMKADAVISAFLLSFSVSYVLSYIALFITGVVFIPFSMSSHIPGEVLDNDTLSVLVAYSLAAALQFFLAHLLFRIRRFRKGFPYLLKGYAVVIALIVSGTVMILTLWGKFAVITDNVNNAESLYVGILTVGFGIYIWVRRGIKMAYRKWAKGHNEELFKQELAEKDREIQQYKDMHDAIASANHRMVHRQTAVERRVAGLLERALGKEALRAEFGEELSAALEDIRNLSGEYKGGIETVKADRLLPSTNVRALDDIFLLFSERFANSNIDFTLKISGSIVYMTEKVIKQSKLETMIGDHLQDALVAVNTGYNAVRAVLALLGESGGCYEFAVHDSGVPFGVETLARLGAERVTTHADSGGTGIGFMTTFETMRECGASLIINEKAPGSAGFTKSVTIRFDGKNQYIIKTYRPQAFPASDRYTAQA
jgi:signal transduction histidine kinase